MLLGRDFGCLPSQAIESLSDSELQAWLLIREAELAEIKKVTHG